MGSVIQTLHDQAAEDAAGLSDLLDNALFYATVLQQKPVTSWLRKERDGYGEDDVLPAYRQSEDAVLIAWQPGAGWIEAPVSDAQALGVTHIDIRTDIAGLLRERKETRKAGMRRMDIDEEQQKELRAKVSLDTRLALMVPASAYERVLDTVRLAIGIWAAHMLEAGIQGHGSAFTREEKDLARPISDELDSIIEEARARQAELPEPERPGLLGRLLGRS